MIKFITKNDLIKYYKNSPAENDFEKRREKLYIDMFDNDLVDALYLYYLDNDEYIGECVLIFKDERSKYEFEYEKDLVNKENSCLLKNLYIREDKRGMGYFTKFLNEIKIIAEKKYCKHLVFSVAKNNKNAIDIYTHLHAYIIDKKSYNDVGDMYFMKIDL